MLLNLGLAADAAAAHSNDLSAQPEPSSVTTLPCPSTFALQALPFLGTLYNYSKQSSDPATPAGPLSAVAMSPAASTMAVSESSTTAPTAPTAPVALTKPRANRSSTAKKSSRPKTLYQFAHPASHAHYKRLRLRPKLLLQVQQVSQTARPLPIIDVLPSWMYLPRLARKFPALFRRKNGLCPYDVIIVMSELYERTREGIPGKQASSEEDDEDRREVVATICQMLQEDARSKGKAEICLNFGPVWEATPLSSGSYEFVAHTDDGVRVMRWALRGAKTRRGTVPQVTQMREDPKRFTFSVIDPNSRRHPVIASMTKNQLEVHDVYSPAVARSTPGPTTPSSGMSVVSDMSDTEAPIDTNDVVTLDDELRTLIIVTGIWVAFREGWSHNFDYHKLASAPNGKGLVSPTSSVKFNLPTIKTEEENAFDRDELSSVKDFSNSRRRMSISSMKRANSVAPEGSKGFGSLSKRSNSAGAAFMERAKRRSYPAANSRSNRHGVFTSTGEHGRDIVISRPPSLRQNSIEPDSSPRRLDRVQNQSKSKKVPTDPQLAVLPDGPPQLALDGVSDVPYKDLDLGKSKRRHRLSSLFTIFHRKH